MAELIQLEYRTPGPGRRKKPIWPLVLWFGVALWGAGTAALVAGIVALGQFEFLLGTGLWLILSLLCTAWFCLMVLAAALPIFDRRRTRTWKAAALCGAGVALVAVVPMELAELLDLAPYGRAFDSLSSIIAMVAIFWGPVFSAMGCTKRT